MRPHRNVKILATLGPASATEDAIHGLYEAGADVFRINMSHGDHAGAAALHAAVRAVETRVSRPIAILADLQGPKLRIGAFDGDQKPELNTGDRFQLDLEDALGDRNRVTLPHPEIFAALEPGARLLLDDGRVTLRVLEKSPRRLVTEVLVGGVVSNRKGVNVPDVDLPLAALTAKDRADLDFMCGLGIDWLALSFVQKPEDVVEARERAAGRAAIMAKIEKPRAVHRIDAILAEADGVMVARGDLGVELPVSDVPPIQKKLVMRARAFGKPVVVATQMLESMISSPSPTRAEVTDVAHAVYEGADAIMLSAESATGAFGREAVRTMSDVADRVERDPEYRRGLVDTRTKARATAADAITAAAREFAETLEVKALCCFTHTGTTAQRMSRERPLVPIMVLTPFTHIARRMVLLWGSHAVVTAKLERFKEAVATGLQIAEQNELAAEGEPIVIIAGVPFNVPGTTNIMRVATVGETIGQGDVMV
ncbi:MAG: pyruvate kinase [Pseudomonadota bacterium]